MVPLQCYVNACGGQPSTLPTLVPTQEMVTSGLLSGASAPQPLMIGKPLFSSKFSNNLFSSKLSKMLTKRLDLAMLSLWCNLYHILAVLSTIKSFPAETCANKPDGGYAEGCTSQFYVCTNGNMQYYQCTDTNFYDVDSSQCLPAVSFFE